MGVYTFSWCRVEGNLIPDLQKEYGTFQNLPNTTKIFYGTPEIQIQNPYQITNGCVYRVIPISSLGNYSTISEIDKQYSEILTKIKDYDKTVETDTHSHYYYEPFVITESSVIFHGDSTNQTFHQLAIILVDSYATPDIITIITKYLGSAIPIQNQFNLKDIQVYAIYSDGNKSIIREGFEVEPKDQIITKIGSNVITVSYCSPTGSTFLSSIIIEGIRNLQGIQAIYDGPKLIYGNQAQKKYFMVTATYSDDSIGVVTDFTFPAGNIVSEQNAGILTIYYKGFYTTVLIPTYEVSSSRLIAFYNGPNIEVGNPFKIEYCKIKIYYKSEDEIHTYYEDINPNDCIFSTNLINHEGINQIIVSYTGKLGSIQTNLIIIGIKPETTLTFIEAEYTGQNIVQGKTYSLEKVICKAHYSNGTIIPVKNFSVNSNLVSYIGANEFLVTYKEKEIIKTATFVVYGLEPDSTTINGSIPIALKNHYPEATRMNYRFRGPLESRKQEEVSDKIRRNIRQLYILFTEIEKEYNILVEDINGEESLKIEILNRIEEVEQNLSKNIKR